jgi:hypothetical protein
MQFQTCQLAPKNLKNNSFGILEETICVSCHIIFVQIHPLSDAAISRSGNFAVFTPKIAYFFCEIFSPRSHIRKRPPAAAEIARSDEHQNQKSPRQKSLVRARSKQT